jgi:multicomponent Na+:H+ antiporter subunit A
VLIVLGVHLVVGLLCLALGKRLGRSSLLVGALGPLSAVMLLAAWLAAGGEPTTESVLWVPAVGLDLVFRMDGFSALMVALVGGIGVLVFFYARHYFSSDQPNLSRFSAYLTLFAGSMFGLVTADNLLILFVFWELTSATSYLLIAFEDENATARSSALQALLVTALGGLAMLAGLVLLGQAAGTYVISELLADPPTGSAVAAGLGLVLLGAMTKSAQFPFHFWLPGAMAAPTPVSAYLHSATMVKAGIYLVARIAPAFALTVDWWRPTLATVGIVTMFVGGWRALVQYDLKQLLAHGTVSQLGFMMLLVGMGIPELTFAGMAVIFAHAAFKGTLFMIAGVVDHQARTRDIRRLTGLRRRMPGTFWLSLVSVASMAGVPPLLGFVAKEAALEGLVQASWPVTVGVVVGSMLTLAYGIRFLVGTFGDRDPAGHDLLGDDVRAPRPAFLAPAALLGVVTVAGGLLPALFDGFVGSAAVAVDAAADGHHLVLWHGFTLALGLSALALAGGAFIWRRPPTRLRSVTSRAPSAPTCTSGRWPGSIGSPIASRRRFRTGPFPPTWSSSSP